MARKKDLNKIKIILKVLVRYPNGVWLRQLSKESKLPISTVHFYIDNVLEDLLENLGVKDKKGRYFGLRIIKLKPKIRETLEKEGLKKVFKYLEMYNKI